MRRWCPLTGDACMGAACAWMVPKGCAVAVLAGGGLTAPPADGERKKRERQDIELSNTATAGRYAEVPWRPIDYDMR